MVRNDNPRPKPVKHPDHVTGWQGSTRDLATRIGAMRYDAQAELFNFLAMEINRQASADHDRHRTQLSARLFRIALDLVTVKEGFDMAWKICEPHMEEEQKTSSES